MVLYLCFTILALIISYFSYLYSKLNYWSKRGIKGPKPLILVGNFGKVLSLKISADYLFKKTYKEFQNEKVVGLYRGSKPVLLIKDPDIIKQVLIKDFSIFQDRGIVSTNNNRLKDNLVGTEGKTWRILRQKLTPTFTSGKLKNMIPLIQKCVDKYMTHVETIVENNVEHEIRSLMAKYTLDVIGSCAFGLDLDTYSSDKNPFKDIGNTIFTPPAYTRMLQILDTIIPGIKKIFSFLDTNSRVSDFFLTLVNNIVNARKGKPMERKDFMDLMIELRDQGRVSRNEEIGVSEIEMDNEMIAAQAVVFYSAGFETSSATMSFMLHELALHQDIQNKLYNEICDVSNKYKGEINYESIKEMAYLNMVLDETLRKHTVAGLLMRKASTDYKVPGIDLEIEKGTLLFVSVSGLHNDPKYFPKPEIFDPERFSLENKEKVPSCAYLPFGEGPRNCIGLRFAKVQSMMGIASFIKKFKVIPSQKTKVHLDYNPKSITLTSRSGIWMTISKR